MLQLQFEPGLYAGRFHFRHQRGNRRRDGDRLCRRDAVTGAVTTGGGATVVDGVVAVDAVPTRRQGV